MYQNMYQADFASILMQKKQNRALSIRARKVSKHEKNGEKQRKTEIVRSPFFGLSDWT